MASIRMSVVVRRDLNMPVGLLAAQVSHIAMLFVQESEREQPVKRTQNGTLRSFDFTDIEIAWIKQPYIAILACDTPEELAVIQKMAKDEGLAVREWRDVVPSKVLEGRVLECLVGIAIGPADSDALRKVTGTLPLYGSENA